MAQLRSLRDELRRDAPDSLDAPDVHIRYTSSVAGVLRYAARRRQPVLPVADALLAAFDADADGLRRRARRGGTAVSKSLGDEATRTWRAEQLAAPVSDTEGGGGSADTFAPAHVDAALLGRLYFSAIAAAAPSLQALALPEDVGAPRMHAFSGEPPSLASHRCWAFARCSRSRAPPRPRRARAGGSTRRSRTTSTP